MCNEHWSAPSIVYICPLKALLNNLGERLERYAQMLGRKAAVWHGDINESSRKHVRSDPPDILLTTPESLEAMLISSNREMKAHLKSLRAVIVDEIHAFAGDDRGWHLVSVVERLAASSGHELQRIGLSATVGNPDSMLRWLAGNSATRQTVIQPPAEQVVKAEVTVDFVGNLENAATIIARLHQGEKRLVFCDSRSRVESLAGLLRTLGVDAFVSHSSLSVTERRRAEEAFARGDNCVIVSTSTLELGIDVGDLDRVIQIDSPARVASFLQRLGRTGRRTGKSRNCLFLCTTDNALLQAVALVELWLQGYVEPVCPPPMPFHIIAQQAMALCLQHSGLGRKELKDWLGKLPPAGAIEEEILENILDYLVHQRILETDGVRVFMGEEGEQSFGRRHFQELVSVFTAPPVLMVTNGMQDLGVVDQNLFTFGTAAKLLSLAGRGWLVQRVDWKERRVYVTASSQQGKTIWFGATRGLSIVLCGKIRHVLTGLHVSEHWSQRAQQQMEQLRTEYAFLKERGSAVVRFAEDGLVWFTFAGESINEAIGNALVANGITQDRVDDFAIYLAVGTTRTQLESALTELTEKTILNLIEVNEDAQDQLKYSECLPDDLRKKQLIARLCVAGEISKVLIEPRYFIETNTSTRNN